MKDPNLYGYQLTESILIWDWSSRSFMVEWPGQFTVFRPTKTFYPKGRISPDQEQQVDLDCSYHHAMLLRRQKELWLDTSPANSFVIHTDKDPNATSIFLIPTLYHWKWAQKCSQIIINMRESKLKHEELLDDNCSGSPNFFMISKNMLLLLCLWFPYSFQRNRMQW